MHYILSQIRRPFTWFWHLRKRNKALVILLLLVIGFFWYRQRSIANARPQYITQKVTRGNIVQLVSETGNVSSGSRTDVYSLSTGVVEEIYVHNKDAVEVGNPLFKVKSTATEQEKAQAYATYLSAKNILDTANANLFTLQSQLFKANQAFINGKGNTKDPVKDDPTYIQQNADWLASEANYKKQQSVISQAQAALAGASLAYQATQDIVVKATANGTITNATLKVGQTVTAKGVAGTTTGVLPALVILYDMSASTVSLSLNEVDVPKIIEGETVKITLDAFPGKTFNGTVESIDGAGTNTAGVITYNVSITLSNPDVGVKPGMTANADIEVDKAQNVLTVPNSAIKPYQGMPITGFVDMHYLIRA